MNFWGKSFLRNLIKTIALQKLTESPQVDEQIPEVILNCGWIF